MRSGCGASGFSATGFEPVGGGESDSFAGQHGGQAGQGVFEIVTQINPETAAVLNAAVRQIGLEFGPWVEGVADGFAQQTFGKNGAAEGHLSEEFFEALVAGAALPGADGFAQDRAVMSLAESFLDRVEVGEPVGG